MPRWYFRDRIPVVQIDERGRFLGFRDPGMELIRGHKGLYVPCEPDNAIPLWGVHHGSQRTARTGGAKLARDGCGYLCAGKAHQRGNFHHRWIPPLFRWRVLAGDLGTFAGYRALRLSSLASAVTK